MMIVKISRPTVDLVSSWQLSCDESSVDGLWINDDDHDDCCLILSSVGSFLQERSG